MCAPAESTDNNVDKWFIEPPGTFEAMSSQCSRSVLNAMRQRRRVVVESAAPELDPASPNFKQQELVAFAHDVAQPLLERAGLSKSQPHVKLLFSNSKDATLAGASIFTTSLPVSMLGHPSAVGPRDGAFVVVAPSPSKDIDTERALADLLEQSGQRLVVLINPRMGNSPLLNTFESAYLMRPLSVGFMRDQMAKQVERVPACLLRCYPHEWTVVVAQPGDARASRVDARWRYAGRFARPPRPEEIEKLLAQEIQRARDEAIRASGPGPGK